MELKKYKLSDFLDSYGDGIHGTPTYSNNGEYYFVNGNNLNNGEIIITPETQRITKTEYEKIKRPLSTQTILLSINGTLGKLAYYKDEKIALGKSACYLNVKQEYDKHYVHYILCTENFKQYMLKVASGSTIKNFAPKQAAEYEFYAPSVEYQRKIASVLSSLDNKIALNRRINAKLEQIAKRLYDYWFVQFNFPDKNGKPYKSSGGKMVWNEVLKREVPEGWEVVPLFKAANIQYGFPFSTELFTEEPTNIPIVRIRDILDGTISAYSLENADEKYHLQEGDVIVGMDGNFHMNYWHDNKAYLNQRCVRIRPFSNSTISSIQILYNIKPYIKAKEKNAKGSTVGHLSDKDLKNLFVLQPKTNPKFNPRSHFDEILKLIIKNKHQILSLTALRDRLLPLLMNGQVKVKG